MAVIAFASQKGGVGKSTLCRALAVEAIRAGLKTVVSDLDAAQGTVHEWAKDRAKLGLEPPVGGRVVPAPRRSTRRGRGGRSPPGRRSGEGRCRDPSLGEGGRSDRAARRRRARLSAPGYSNLQWPYRSRCPEGSPSHGAGSRRLRSRSK